MSDIKLALRAVEISPFTPDGRSGRHVKFEGDVFVNGFSKMNVNSSMR